MKRSVFFSGLVLLLFMIFPSCDMLFKPSFSSKITFKSAPINKFSSADTIVFSGKDVKSYNATTGEVIFIDSKIAPIVNKYRKFKCYLGADSLFVFTQTSDMMSVIVNDLVLNHNLNNDRYFFADGYPDWIDNLGVGGIRAQNKANRATAWLRFIEQLKIEGKYSE